MPELALVIIILFFFSVYIVSSNPYTGYFINCGARQGTAIDPLSRWTPDDAFVAAGIKWEAAHSESPGLMPILSSLRHFPDSSARKWCYVIPVLKSSRYLVRTTYYYNGFDGVGVPPVFDQIIGGTKWSVVNTREDFARGMATFYEVILAAHGKTLSVCLAKNDFTESSPFISAIEVTRLEDNMYNSTNFESNALAMIARHSFGNPDGHLVSYPEDQFNRYWLPFTDSHSVVESQSNISSTDLWNHPPETVLQRGQTNIDGRNLILQWPPQALAATNYYMALYFKDNRPPGPLSWRMFDVSINGKKFYDSLNVTTSGVMVYGTWPLSGHTQITLAPHPTSLLGPIINAAELFQVVPFGERTRTSDVIAMESLARSFQNPPTDWSGDPCLPRDNSWTGVTCSSGKFARVISLNLMNFGISGVLPENIAKLTAISILWLGGNKLSGTIPYMGSLKNLVSLHLEDNQLSGSIPPSLGNLEKLEELFLQNNNLEGHLPDSIKQRKGIHIQITPGNQID